MICPVHGSIADKMKRHQGLSFCTIELDMVKDQTVRLYEYLETVFEAADCVFRRGFHIHVFDKEAYLLSIKQRTEIAERTKQRVCHRYMGYIRRNAANPFAI